MFSALIFLFHALFEIIYKGSFTKDEITRSYKIDKNVNTKLKNKHNILMNYKLPNSSLWCINFLIIRL